MVARDEWFGRLPVRKVMLSSPALRTRETALHMAGKAELLSAPSAEQPLLIIDALHPSGQSDICEEIFKQKGDAPLRAHLDADGGETAFSLYAEATCEELTAKFREYAEKPNPNASLRTTDTTSI